MGQTLLILAHSGPDVCRNSVHLSVMPVYRTLVTANAVCALCIWAFICIHPLHTGRTFLQSCSPADSGDKFILDRCSAGHTVGQAYMSQAGSMCDLHSHMPGGVLIQATAEREVCCSGRAPWSSMVTQWPEAHIKYLSRGSKPGRLPLQRSFNVSLQFMKGI